jgi:protein involved in polysaccharide export with SLBB domain
MVKRLIPVFLLFSFSLYAQQFAIPGTGTQENSSQSSVQYLPQAIVPLQAIPDTADNLQLAISNRQYPVTPGDVYELTFLLAGETVSNTLLVESDYTINMTIFGKLNALGMTFAQLKPVVEQKIADAYPRSLPSLNIISVGIFQVPIRGEIPESRYVTAWGLSRLNEVLEENLGNYSSIRDIEIISGSGESVTYDLLMALNKGILLQNPTIKPDDIIVVNRIRREIRILGEVYKPGTYQLLDSEKMSDVESFTGGFTPIANPSRIRVDRYSGSQPVSFSITEKEFHDFELHHGDKIYIPSIEKIQPVVYVEGSINQ